MDICCLYSLAHPSRPCMTPKPWAGDVLGSLGDSEGMRDVVTSRGVGYSVPVNQSIMFKCVHRCTCGVSQPRPPPPPTHTFMSA